MRNLAEPLETEAPFLRSAGISASVRASFYILDMTQHDLQDEAAA
jgi:hypothetical protein